jgi:16S rRNA (guanine1516-N2)-methyltransferase
LVLAVSDERLELREPETRPGRGLSVDFSSLNPRQASSRGGFSRRQPLARAIGKATQTALDATAGLGHDAALLACMGYRVTAVERSPIIAALLRDGLRRAMNNPALHEHLRDHLRIINTDARDVLRTQTTQPDAVYIDPMFPPKRKASALARKSVRLVRQIVGEDEDAADLLAVARQHAGRVVVKRPTYAPPLAAKPTMSFTGKLVRYDVYLTNA